MEPLQELKAVLNISYSKGTMSTPHVFVTMGNLLNVRCDAWLLPTDSSLTFNPYWTTAMPHLVELVAAQDMSSVEAGMQLAVALDDWPVEDPLPVLTTVPLHGVRDPEELRPRFRNFFDESVRALKHRSLLDRPFPLLAVPFFGTGLGAGNIYRGDILRVLLSEAHEAARALLVDVVFVFQDQAAYALAQQQRKEFTVQSWENLSPRLQDL